MEIIRSEMPKNSEGLPCVLDRVVSGWFHGDRQIIANNELPAIVVDGNSQRVDWLGYRMFQINWNISVICYIRADDADDATTLINEMTRIVANILKKHSKIWVFEPCIFDMEYFHSPAHLQTHDELDPIVNEIRDDFITRWNITHLPQGTGGSIPTAPTIDDNEAYIMAYIKYFTQYAASNEATVAYYDFSNNLHYTNVNKIYSAYINDDVKPVRLLSFVKIDNIQYGYVPKKNNQILRASEIQLSAVEIEPVFSFGPNNVI